MEKELAELLGFSVFMSTDESLDAHVVDVQIIPNFNSEGNWLVAVDHFHIDNPPAEGDSPCRAAYLVADHLIVPIVPAKKGWNPKDVEEAIEDPEGAKGFIEDIRKEGLKWEA